ncbi:hypothetical protein BH24ACI2_BH24ACI2_02820 [soil metagenome]
MARNTGNFSSKIAFYTKAIAKVSMANRDEIFAPVAMVEKFSDFAEAVDLSNHTKYGLQAGVFTQNLANAQHASGNLEYVGVIINDVPTFRVDNMPYGSLKDSGFGREGVKYPMEEMSEIRLVVVSS